MSIAKTTVRLQSEVYAKPLIDIPKMCKLVQQMVRDALDAYIHMNMAEAKLIANRDDEVDALYKQIFTDLIELMNQDRSLIHQGTHLLMTAQYLERIGDYVTNICE